MSLLTVSLALAAESFEGHTYWIGDPHAHTGLSRDAGSLGEACPSCRAQAHAIQSARDIGLNRVAFTDHVNDRTSSETGHLTFLAFGDDRDLPGLSPS
ncbi:MAG: hypothetical protein EXR71_16550 [Myxococcales bacterium]|nr:hypothetical protein [Myxococcales bacterium]